MRSDKLKRHNDFAKLISQLIEEGDPGNTCHFEGFAWAAWAQPIWCNHLGVTPRTLRELAKQPPVVVTHTKLEGKKIALYRIGDAPHVSTRTVASKMSAHFSKKTGCEVSRRAYGCLNGLAGLWPQDHQLRIFKHVIAEWGEFMAGVTMYETDDDQEAFSGRYYRYPSIALMRKYPRIGYEMYCILLQSQGVLKLPSMQSGNLQSEGP